MNTLFEWKSAGATVGTAKTYELQSTDVGKIIQCAITVAEPDGSNPEIRTATYTETIEVLGTINTPEVLAPADGAGSGNARYLKSDAITEVEGGGVDRCETELIESVDQFTISTDIGLWTLTGASNILQYYPNGSYGPFDSASDGYIYASNQVNRGGSSSD